MSTFIEKHLYDWQKSYIRDQDIQTFFFNENSKRYDAVKYALKKGYLVKIKRGLYYVNLPNKKLSYDLYEIAQTIYSPSYISLESALSFYGWIPEAVYTTTASTTRRSKKLDTPIGHFSFLHVPPLYFYDEVNRIESGESIFFIAEPWKALADYMYVYKKDWHSLQDLSFDLRIETETIEQSNFLSLEKISKFYDNKKVRVTLSRFVRELKQ